MDQRAGRTWLTRFPEVGIRTVLGAWGRWDTGLWEQSCPGTRVESCLVLLARIWGALVVLLVNKKEWRNRTSDTFLEFPGIYWVSQVSERTR